MKKSVIIFLLAMIPNIAAIFLLIENFPYTGLGRIVSIPITLFFNITILIISLFITRIIKSRLYKCMIWITVVSINVLVAIVLHPQEFLPSVLMQLRELLFSNTD